MSFDPKTPLYTRLGFSGQQVPYYGLIFDKRGTCKSPKTRDAVLQRIADEGFTDTILYSHGWNNDWDDATQLYTAFLDGVGAMATRHEAMLPAGIKPLFIGISWPSAAFRWPWEGTPDLAAGGEDDGYPPDPDDLEILAEDMEPETAARLREIAGAGDTLDAEQVKELAALLAPQMGDGDAEDTGAEDTVTADNLAEMLMQEDLTSEDVGASASGGGFASGGTVGGGAGNAQAAGGLSDLFGLRKVLRLATVYKMKDRAGKVGRVGVADSLGYILAKTQTRLHVVGHSYGAKVVMTAVSKGPAPRLVTSALMLQPAANLLAFAPDVLGRPGGFRPALARVEKPILATYSRDDFPLRKVFHLAVRREKDLGEEPDMAAGISRWSAMGGFGAKNLAAGELMEIEMPNAGAAYPPVGTAELVSLHATGKITGHSKVCNEFTFWAMLQNLT